MFLYALTIFLGAFLLFQVQPLIAKIILPWFGGSAAVWMGGKMKGVRPATAEPSGKMKNQSRV